MKSAQEIVSDYYTYLKQRDQERLIELLSDQITVTYHGQVGQLPWAGKFQGIDGFHQFFNSIREHLDIIEVTIIDSIHTDDKFINRCEGKWKYKSTGYVVEGSMVNAFAIANGKITEYDVYADTAAFLAGFNA